MVQEEREISIPLKDGVEVKGTLAVADRASGIVLFAHGSGSSRYSPRNRYVADVLQSAGLATLLVDLLTTYEERADRFTGHLRFDIELLSGRVLAATHWLQAQPETRHLPVGYFGSSTGAAAALVAAAVEPQAVGAVVSRGGRPDLAGTALERVQAPTLLIVGGADELVLTLNQEALALLQTEKRLKVVPGATHLFEEPGTLEKVAELATQWLSMHLRPAAAVEVGAWEQP